MDHQMSITHCMVDSPAWQSAETEAQSRKETLDPPFTNVARDQRGGSSRFHSMMAGLVPEYSSTGHQAGLQPQYHAAPWLASVLPVAGK